jgi:hypothetical protein
MPSSLADPFLKTVRAKEHLDDLRERLRRFREESEPIRVVKKDDIENQRYVIHFHVKDCPDKLPLILGDCLYCLRSSLDQLVWALAKGVGSYPAKTQFPILDSPDDDLFRKHTTGIPADAVTVIEALQPYRAPDVAAVKSHLLWRLNLLCNIDKHRRIPTDGTITHFNFPEFPTRLGHLIDHDEEAGVVSVPLALKSKMRLDPTASINVTFGDTHEGIQCDFEGLEQIYKFVTESVLPRFARFF